MQLPVVQRLTQTLRLAQIEGNEAGVRDRWRSLESFLAERPTSDRYWVARYRDFLIEAFNNQPKSGAVYGRLGNLAKQWAQECAAKADTNVIKLFYDSIFNFSYRDEQFTKALTFALMRHIVSKPSASGQIARELERAAHGTNSRSIVDYLRSTELAADEDFAATFEQLSMSLRAALIKGRRREIEGYTKLFGKSGSLPPQVSEIRMILQRLNIANFQTLRGWCCRRSRNTADTSANHSPFKASRRLSF